jgi:general transcription factor IIIA
MTTHHNITHLGRRDHICPHENCNSAFGYKHLLQRHLAKIHSAHTGDSDPANPSNEEDIHEKDKAVQQMDIDTITGFSYASNANERISSSNALRCPYPDLGLLTPESGNPNDTGVAGASTSKGCGYVFSRAYDLRRHLRAEHGVDVEKEKADEWVKRAKARTRKDVME